MYRLNCDCCFGNLLRSFTAACSAAACDFIRRRKSPTHLALSAPFKWAAVTECQDRAEGQPEMLRDTDKEFFRLYFWFVTFQEVTNFLKNLGF